MADSKTPSPRPCDDSSSPNPTRPDADEDAIDLGRYTSAEEGGSALSFTGRSGARGGSSVITWDELVRQQAPDDEPLEVHHGRDDDIDPDSDKDLLRAVLADEPPPSGIIYKDPSAEHKIMRPVPPVEATPPRAGAAGERQGPGSSFILPPELQATRPAAAGGTSRLDLVADVARGAPSDPQARTDQLGTPPIIGRPGAVALPPADAESSGLDLGLHPLVDLPFPLGVDSSVGSSLVGRGRATPQPPPASPADSGVVDLQTKSSEFDLDLRPPGPSTADELRARDNPPSTVPLALAGPSRTRAWVGGGLVGLLAGLAASLALTFSGAWPTASSGQPRPDDARAEARAAAERAQKAKAELDALTALLQQAHLDPADLPAAGQRLTRAEADAAQGRQTKAELDRLNNLLRQAELDPTALAGQLAQVRAAADEARQARAKLDALTVELQQARLDPADLPSALRRLAAARTAAEGAVQAAETQLVRLRDQLTQATAEAQTVEERLKGQLAQVTTSWQALTTFAQDVARRLQATHFAAANAAPAELLAGLDRALARQPGSLVEPNPAAADQAFAKGWHAYRDRDYAAAEQWFTAAERANDRDARYPYFLGLARLAQGHSDAATADFRRGAALEGQNLPNPREVDRALEAVPRDARLTIGGFRPYH